MSTDSTSTTTTYGTISKSFNGTSNAKPNGKVIFTGIRHKSENKIRTKSYPERNVSKGNQTKFNSNPSSPISSQSSMKSAYFL